MAKGEDAGLLKKVQTHFYKKKGGDKGFWIHNGLVTMNREKMAKSTGNFITLDGALKKCPGEVIRYFLLSSHYRSPLDYSENSLREASSSLNRVYTLLGRVEEETKDMDIFEKEKITTRIHVTPEF